MTPSKTWLIAVFIAGTLVATKGDAYLYSDCDTFPDGTSHYRTCNPCVGPSCKVVYNGNGTCSLVDNGVTTLTVPDPCTGDVGTCCDQYECGPTCTPNQVNEPAVYKVAQEPPVNVYCTGTCKDGSVESANGAGQSVVDAINSAHTGIDIECVNHGGTDTYDSNCTLVLAPATSTWNRPTESKVGLSVSTGSVNEAAMSEESSSEAFLPLQAAVRCGFIEGGPNRLIGCAFDNNHFSDCHNGPLLQGADADQATYCNGANVVYPPGALRKQMSWNIDGQHNICNCQEWECLGNEMNLVRQGIITYTWHGKAHGICCHCLVGAREIAAS